MTGRLSSAGAGAGAAAVAASGGGSGSNIPALVGATSNCSAVGAPGGGSSVASELAAPVTAAAAVVRTAPATEVSPDGVAVGGGMASTDLRNVPRSTEGAEATESSCESFAAPALEDGVLFEFAAATLSVVRATAAAGVDTGAGPTDSIPGTGRPRGAVLRLGRSPDCSEACSTSGLSAFVPPAGSASGIDVVASEGPTRGISAGAGVAIG